jgi:hypothetical protein
MGYSFIRPGALYTQPAMDAGSESRFFLHRSNPDFKVRAFFQDHEGA